MFRWTCDCDVTCSFIVRETLVTAGGGDAVAMGQGGLVIFPAGLWCSWDMRHAVHKHCRFG
jgi:uncharacterized cupin superfamily protein